MLSSRPPSLLKRLWLSTLRTSVTSSSPLVVGPSQLRHMAVPSAQASTMATHTSATPIDVGRRSRSPTRVPGPVETAIQSKLIEAFQPVLIRISNDSSKHAHHSAMRAQGGGSGETHFAVAVVSPAFEGKTQIARHRLVNALLKDEFATGLHALSLRLKTPDEWEETA